MAEPVEFEVVSESDGKFDPEQNAVVRVIARDKVGEDARWPFDTLAATHKHAQNGIYKIASGNAADEPGAGEWLLVVTLSDKSPVVQRLTLSEKGGALVAVAGWSAPASKETQNRALTVQIMNYQQTQGAAPPGPPANSRVSVRLFPRLEMVGLACLDNAGGHLGGMRFDEFARSRTRKVFGDGTLNDGVIFTLLIANQRITQVLVKAVAPARDAWIVLEEHQKSPPPLSKRTPDANNDIGALDFYQHLQDVGRVAPGSVVEAGIFGHAYVLGPIVWNTFDQAPSFTDRDPADFDARSKDWVPNGVVDTQFPLLPSAFHQTKGALRAWGCNHMNNVLWGEITGALNEMRKGTSRNEFFQVKLVTGGRENLTLDHLKKNLAQFVVAQKIKHTIEHGDATGVVAYCGAAAQKLMLPVFGAPPGLGSSIRSNGGDTTLFIDPEAGDPENGQNAKHPDGNKLYLDYYTKEFGAFFVVDDLHYMNYKEMLPAPLTDPGWATERFIVYRDDDLKQQILRLPSGLEVYRPLRSKYTDPTPSTQGGISGHLYVVPGAKVNHVEDRNADRLLMVDADSKEDTGIFVGKDGNLLLLRSPASKNDFTTNTDPVRVDTMTFDGGLNWSVGTSAASTFKDGVLQTVRPQWFW